MKKVVPILISIFIGVLFGNSIFSLYKKEITEEVLSQNNSIYMLQQGVYSSYESMEENTSDISDYLYIKKDDKYYVYVGFTSNRETAEKLKQNYPNIYVKENNTNNLTLANKLKENDNSIVKEENKQNLMSMSKKSLEIYEEMMNISNEY